MEGKEIRLQPFLYVITENDIKVIENGNKLCLFNEEDVLEVLSKPKWQIYHYHDGIPKLCEGCSSEERILISEFCKYNNTYSIYYNSKTMPLIDNLYIFSITPPNLLVPKWKADEYEKGINTLRMQEENLQELKTRFGSSNELRKLIDKKRQETKKIFEFFEPEKSDQEKEWERQRLEDIKNIKEKIKLIDKTTVDHIKLTKDEKFRDDCHYCGCMYIPYDLLENIKKHSPGAEEAYKEILEERLNSLIKEFKAYHLAKR